MELFRVFYAMNKQAYKFELSAMLKIDNIFHISPLDQDMIMIGRVNKFLE